jgi:hypothetical protein
MSKAGKIITRKGKLRVFKGGSIAVFDAIERCPECCECKPLTLHSVNLASSMIWRLTEYYDKDHIAPPGTYWRLINNYTSYIPIEQGCVDANGRLVNLPASISPTSYRYTGTPIFRLEIGCQDKTRNYINWPDGSRSDIFLC